MIPVYQTRFGRHEGNCFAASVASILDLTELPDLPPNSNWWTVFRDYLAPFGLTPVFVSLTPQPTDWWAEWLPQGVCLVSGLSPRQDGQEPPLLHSVVYSGGVMVHDPHPDGGGIRDIRDYIVLAPLDPAPIFQKKESGTMDEMGNAAREQAVRETKQWRKDLDEVLQRIKEPGCLRSRERSLAITKIQEAIMWLGMDLKGLAEPNPYPESYNPDSPVISPTADGLKL